MMKRAHFLLLILCMSFFFISLNRPPLTIDYVHIADKIVAKTAKNLCKKHNMNWIGDSAGMMDCVYMMGMSFEIRHPLDKDEARFLLTDCAEELLTAINQNKEIRPFLSHFPATTKNVHLAIFSTEKDGNSVFDPYFEVVSISKQDFINFRTKDPNKKYGYKNEYRENYKEALELVREQLKAKDASINN